ncbi:OprD family porin [Pseudomonas asiatica]|uniref:OprD family porin n=1 Tax=Pseudomonas asiatica TaxID=2219225 RepID=UPI002DBE8906|nr:OprD family porin [Pseudomonas asiatica]MEB6588844.1 OprD family porin [Pseudomonas asiatica]
MLDKPSICSQTGSQKNGLVHASETATVKISSAAAIAFLLSGPAWAGQSETAGFIKDSSLSILAKNYYFNTDRAGGRSNQKDWTQAFIATYESGFTQGFIGVGVDAFAYWGIKLDAGSGRTGTGNLPVGDDGDPDDEYARVGGAVKARISNTVLRYGQMSPSAPVFAQSVSRLMPQTATGFHLSSNEIDHLALEAGHFTSGTDQVNTNRDGELWATYALVTTPAVDYAGARYKATDNLSLAAYGSRFEDIWNQYYINANYIVPLSSAQALTFDFNLYRTTDNGNAKAGTIDTTAAGIQAAYKFAAHTLSLAYQQVAGDQPFDYVGFGDTGRSGGSIFLPNSVQYSDFNGPGEKSWQLRYDLNMTGYGIPGLTLMIRHLRGQDIDGTHAVQGAYANKYGDDDKEFETDAEARYVVQSGPAKDLSMRLRLAWHRGDASTGGDQDQVRVITEYPFDIF